VDRDPTIDARHRHYDSGDVERLARSVTSALTPQRWASATLGFVWIPRGPGSFVEFRRKQRFVLTPPRSGWFALHGSGVRISATPGFVRAISPEIGVRSEPAALGLVRIRPRPGLFDCSRLGSVRLRAARVRLAAPAATPASGARGAQPGAVMERASARAQSGLGCSWDIRVSGENRLVSLHDNRNSRQPSLLRFAEQALDRATMRSALGVTLRLGRSLNGIGTRGRRRGRPARPASRPVRLERLVRCSTGPATHVPQPLQRE